MLEMRTVTFRIACFVPYVETETEGAMRVFIAGGAGVIGRRLIPLLVERKHDVVATTHSTARLDALRDRGAHAILMNGLDATSVGRAVAQAGPDVIVHQMTALSGKPDMRHFDRWFSETNALRSDGTRHLISAALATGARRFVAQSFTGWTNKTGRAGPADESEPLEDHPPDAQHETLAAIRTLESTVTAASLSGIVLRYGMLYGPGATDDMARMVKRRLVPVIGAGQGVTSFIHADDAAWATVLATESTSKGIYNVVDDDPAPAAEWLPALAAALGAKPPRHMPVWLARLLAGDVIVNMMTATRGASNARAREALQWTPRWRSWREGFQHAL
jgi:nucleoside-diphosphate-sugar epimerase